MLQTLLLDRDKCSSPFSVHLWQGTASLCCRQAKQEIVVRYIFILDRFERAAKKENEKSLADAGALGWAALVVLEKKQTD